MIALMPTLDWLNRAQALATAAQVRYPLMGAFEEISGCNPG